MQQYICIAQLLECERMWPVASSSCSLYFDTMVNHTVNSSRKIFFPLKLLLLIESMIAKGKKLNQILIIKN